MKRIITLFKHGKRWIVAALVCSNLALFSLTNPETVTSPTLIAGYLLLITTLFCLTSLTLDVAEQIGLKVGKHHRKFTLGATGLVALLVALQSIGQLSGRDIAVAVPFAIITYMYITYNQSVKQNQTL